MKVLVTGATGTTARALIPVLGERGAEVVAASRRPGPRGVRFDWYDPDSHAAALDGVDRVYLVPPPDADPVEVMGAFLERAHRRGVRRAVLLGASAVPTGGPMVGRVARMVLEVFEEAVVLRPSWFMQNFTGDHPHAAGFRERGAIATATGGGRVGFVDVRDIAAVAAHALTDAEPIEREPVLTGPEALSYDEVAAIYGEVTGREVVHESLEPGAVERALAAAMPVEVARILVGLDGLIAAGAEDRVTDTVERIAGRPPGDLRTVLRRDLRP
ncbi:NAD-dependent epimerase/dehydratase family protein [Nocardiopsis sp. CC223A]|uniref:NAD-dependent epimerase/dehydratase family protein n=1 Tax=Nocardiopsis sp. CC223A TaxID=3044051 RepID=UPI00278BECE4|nr:NAD-dependent epimerase/dehydratase family protein [Nocardiopsis sp. CC223A]